MDVLMDTKAQPCLPLDVFWPGVKNLAVGPPAWWECGLPPLLLTDAQGLQ